MTGTDVTRFDVIVVGAGFAGLYALHKFRKLGFSVRGIEAGDGVGGVWYWNRYPGARCDVESLAYSYSFDKKLEQEWVWPERYSAQPDILAYAEHVAERFDLKRDIQFKTKVVSARFDETNDRWTVTTEKGAQLSCRFLVMASGSLSTANKPGFPGIENFKGRVLYPSSWPKDQVDLTDKNVAIIGTGSSAIQIVATIAKTVKKLTVFQRTPNFSVPMRNRKLSADEIAEWKRNADAKRKALRESRSGQLFEYSDVKADEMTAAEREAEMERRWRGGSPNFMRSFADMMTNETANEYAADFVRRKIAEIVKDPKTAELLMPSGYPIGTKRICVDFGYYETFNLPNVNLVSLRKEPLERIAENGVVTAGGTYPADTLIVSTGFDAVTGPLLAIDIRGIGGTSLRDEWRAGPRTYLGLLSAGFPNLFMVTGPGSPGVTVNVILAIEQHVDWIAQCLVDMRQRGHTRIDADPKYQDEWVDLVRTEAEKTLFPRADSFYMGANVPGKPRVFLCFPSGLPAYAARCDAVREANYKGFILGGRVA